MLLASMYSAQNKVTAISQPHRGETRRRKHTCIKNAYFFFKNSLINFTSNSYHSKALFLFYNMVSNENKPPRKELTDVQRNRIIGAYECGVKGSAIVEQLGLPPSTVYDTIKRYNKTGSPHPQNRSGRPKILNERDERALVRIANSARDFTLANITGELGAALGKPISTKTTGKYLNKLGWKSC